MRSIKFLFILLTVFALVGGFFVWRGFGRAKEVLPSKSEPILETLSNEDGEVKVVITPKALAQDFWSFEVTLDTHSVELTDDLAEVSFLVDENGKTFKALGWEGDPPGGHHISGILKYSPISPGPDNIELRIKLNSKERSFKWKLSE